MERHEIFAMMRALKLVAPEVRVPRNGMPAAHDETMRAGLQHKRAPTEIIGDLLKADLAEARMRHNDEKRLHDA